MALVVRSFRQQRMRGSVVHALGFPQWRKKKMETPLDVGEAESLRCPWRAGSFRCGWRYPAMQTIRFRPSASRATIRPCRHCLVLYPHSFAGIPDAARGVSCCGTFVPVTWRERPWSGAGVEPATRRLFVCCSTQLSYPVVDEPDSNRWRTAFAVALPLSYRPRETPSPTLRHTPR